VTISAFVLSGSTLKATVTLEGPVADLSVNTGKELQDQANEFTNSNKKPARHLAFSEVVDFEHLNEELADDELESSNDDLLKQPIDPNDPDAENKRRERREMQRKKFLEEKQKREERKLAQLAKVRQDGEPFVYTTKAPAAGWYRMCVMSSWNQVCSMIEHVIVVRIMIDDFSVRNLTCNPLFYLSPCDDRSLLKWKCGKKVI
jgi:hypothetical protein